MQPVRLNWNLRWAFLALTALSMAGLTGSCSNPDEQDPDLGFALQNTPNTRVVMLDPRFRQGTDPFQAVNLERFRLDNHTLPTMLQAISSATSTIDIAAFELSSQTMVNTLVGLANRGVQIRVVTEGGQFSSLVANPAQALLTSMRQAGIDVRVDNDDLNRAMNARYAIIDNRMVIVGSADLLSQGFYDTLAGDIKGSVNSALIFDSSRTIPPGGGAAQVNTLLDAFAFDFEEMFIRGKFGHAKDVQTKTSFDVGVKVDLFFGPNGNIRDALSETIFDTEAVGRYAIGQFTDNQILNFLAQVANNADVQGVFDGFLTPNGQAIIDNADGLPYFYAGLNVMNHQWYAADFPRAIPEFLTPVPGRDPVLFVTTNPWTARSFDNDDAVGVRIHDVSTAVRYGLIEFPAMLRATGVDPTTGRPNDPATTVLVFGEVRSRSNNAPIEATVSISSMQIGYLPGDGGMPISAETDPDTGDYGALVPAGDLTVDVTEVDGPYLLPPSDTEVGARFPAGSAEVNFYLNLQPSGTSGGSGGG